LAGQNGQGKGGAIFAMSGATAFASNFTFVGNIASDPGTSATDNANFFGTLVADTIFHDDFDGDGF
ncbi:MAG: hypothetical protein ACREO6_07925, partial [Rudaea sp.]